MPTPDETLLQAWQIHQQGNPGQAERVYRSVIEQNPQHANAWCYLGIALHDQKHYTQSVAAYHKALEFNPRFPIALNNLGNSLRYLGRIDEADAAFQKALDIDPKYFNAYRNRGTLHAWSGRIDRAFQHYFEAMQLNPNDSELHRNLGVIHLLQGNFKEGWREYRYRWQCNDAIQHRYTQPKWTGQDLKGKTLLLYSEQGLGDTIHFVRLAETVKQLGARTIVHIQAPLLAILQSCKGIDFLIPNTLRVDEPFDYHCSLLDVADVLCMGDSKDPGTTSIPARVPYIHAPQNLVEFWRGTLNKALPKSRLRVGIVWQGNPDHQADLYRSVPLNALKPLADVDGVQLISLQRGKGTEQLRTWNGNKVIYCLPEDIDQSSGAFMDTAAILNHLDVIVTSDTSMAHLAGAMGRPTSVMLSYTPDWRWMQQRTDSPWYPTAKLYRQPKIGDWDSVVRAIGHDLSQTESVRNDG